MRDPKTLKKLLERQLIASYPPPLKDEETVGLQLVKKRSSLSKYQAHIGENYLPYPRSIVRPKAAGGAIHVECEAPNDRLDRQRQFDRVEKEIQKMNINELVRNLGLSDILKLADDKMSLG